MSDVASLENSKRLYELSGWINGRHFYYHKKYDSDVNYLPSLLGDNLHPAYTAGFLLRKLPYRYYVRRDKISAGGDWWCYDITKGIATDKGGEGILADTPEDALCLLAIQLFKQGVLTKGD